MFKNIPISLWIVLLYSLWSIYAYVSGFKAYLNSDIPNLLNILFAISLKAVLVAGILKRWSWTWKCGIAAGIYSLGTSCSFYFSREDLKSTFSAGLLVNPSVNQHITPEQFALVSNIVIMGMVAMTMLEGIFLIAIFIKKRNFFSKTVQE